MTIAGHMPMGDGVEFDAIRRLLDVWGAGAQGIGDDAAVLDVPSGERLVVSTDASIEGVHFRRDWMTAREIGGRATAAALSDLAAMACAPRGLLLALGLPAGWHADLEELARGVGDVASSAGCPIVGGNISAASELSLTITVLGSAVRPLSRHGARPGDIIHVTGRLGGPSAALRELEAGRTPRAEHRSRFVAPVPRLREAMWLAAIGATASIDISDGLLADAGHLARASRVSIELHEGDMPRIAGVSADDVLSGGEEYELLVALPGASDVDTAAFEREFGVPLTRVGDVTAEGDHPVRVDGRGMSGARGHDHLAR